MKKIYMPPDDKLSEMQSLGINLKSYIEIKMAELMIVNSINNNKKSKLSGAYKYILDNMNILHSICLLYPEEIQYAKLSQYDIQLLKQLINKSHDETIYNLDNLSNFAFSNIYSSSIIIQTIGKLQEQLLNRPEYRFQYQDNSLLDDIFTCKIIPELFEFSYKLIVNLVEIEPAYAVLIYQNKLDKGSKKELLKYGLSKYMERYGLCENIYTEEDILKQEETKRLIKAIRRNKFIID